MSGGSHAFQSGEFLAVSRLPEVGVAGTKICHTETVVPFFSSCFLLLRSWCFSTIQGCRFFFFFLKICPTSQKLRFSTSQKQGFCFGPGISHVARQDECRDSLEPLLLSRVRPIFHLLPSWLSAGGGYDQINPNGKVRDACSSVALALLEQTFF